MLGKIFMISGSKNFDKNLFLKNNQTFISLLSDNSKPINKFLYNIKNPYLFLDLHADFEVVGQYQILNIDEESKKIIKQIFPKIIKKYPLEYIKISLFNYLGLWSPGGKKIFLNAYIQDNKIENIPLKSKLQMASGEILEISKIILLASLLFFSLLFLLFTIFSITTFLNFFKKKKLLINDFFLIVVQIYLLSVAFLNISTPRYLMPVYPIVIYVIFIKIKMYYYESISFKNGSQERK